MKMPFLKYGIHYSQSYSDSQLQTLENLKSNRYRLKPREIAAIEKMREADSSNVLVVGDLHCPWDLDEYLPWVVEQYDNYNCNQIIFIGDVLDSAGYSYHEQNPDLPSAGDELNYAIQRVQRWYSEFNQRM